MNKLQELLLLAKTNPSAAAEEIDKMIRSLETLKNSIINPMRSTGGVSDRVQMQVIGPDGAVKQTVDTR